MEFLYAPVFINIIWVGAAFLFGFVVRQVGLPPMIGFLLAGFSLNFMGLTQGSLALDSIADMGVMLLLFTVGLKLDIRGLAKPEIWAGNNHSLSVVSPVLLPGYHSCGYPGLFHVCRPSSC